MASAADGVVEVIMRSLFVFAVVIVTGCSSAPIDMIDKAKPDAGSTEPDAAPKPKPPVGDAAAHDSSVQPKPTPQCPNVPDDVSNWQPPAPKPARVQKSACGAGQLTGFYANCFGPMANEYTCNDWQAATSANASCMSCVVSWDYDSSWGPVVNEVNYSFSNQTGCVEILTQNPAPQGSCAYAWNADYLCAKAACDSLCPVAAGGIGLQELIDCENTALAGGCKAYDDTANATCETDGGAYAKCFGTGMQGFIDLASTFCGGT